MEKVRKIMSLLIVVLVLLASLYYYQGSMLSEEIELDSDVEETSNDATIVGQDITSSVLVYNNIINNGDPWFNVSDAFGFTWAMADIWNQTGGSGGLNMSNITNSNNNEWPVTEGNLEIAINDVGTTGWVCIGSDMTTTYEINMSGHDGVHLNFMFNVVTLSGDISFINFTNCNFGGLWNVDIRVSTQTGSIIMVYSETDANRVDYLTIDNVNIQNTGGTYGSSPWSYTEHNFTGIELFADDVGGTGRVFEAYINNVVIEGPDVGVLIKTSGAGYINGCDLYHIYTEQPVTGIEVVEISSTNGANSNNFYSYRTQTAKYSEYGFKNISGDSNSIYSSLPWDWSISLVPVYGIWVGSGGVNTKIEVDAKDLVDSVLDEGLGSSIKCGNRELYYDADYDYKVTTNGTHYFARLGEYGDMPVSGSYDKTTDFQVLMYNILNHDDIVVKLGAGVFYPDSYIEFRGKNITIEGTGDHQTIIRCVDSTQYVSGLFNMNGAEDCNATFRNLVIDGTGASDTSIGLYFCASESMHGLDVHDCEFINWVAGTSKAIYVRPSSSDHVYFISLTNNDFYNNDYGIYFDGDGDSDINWSEISHNEFDDCDISIALDYTNFTRVTDNTIRNGGTEGISLQGNSSQNIITENVIEATTGIELDATCNRNIVKDNNVYLCTTKITNSGANNRVVDNMGDDL